MLSVLIIGNKCSFLVCNILMRIEDKGPDYSTTKSSDTGYVWPDSVTQARDELDSIQKEIESFIRSGKPIDQKELETLNAKIASLHQTLEAAKASCAPIQQKSLDVAIDNLKAVLDAFSSQPPELLRARAWVMSTKDEIPVCTPKADMEQLKAMLENIMQNLLAAKSLSISEIMEVQDKIIHISSLINNAILLNPQQDEPRLREVVDALENAADDIGDTAIPIQVAAYDLQHALTLLKKDEG